MGYTLLHGDCMTLLPTLPDASVDLVLADLPYGTTNCKWDSPLPLDVLWKQYKRVLRRGGAVVLTASQPFTSALVMSNPAWFRYAWVWEKSTGTGFLDVHRRPLKCHEDVLVFAADQPPYKPIKTPTNPRKTGSNGGSVAQYATNTRRTGHNNGESYPRSVLYFRKEIGTQHSTQKPLALGEYLIRTYTDPGAVVLDNTMGVGSFGVAAVQTGRDFIGIERDAGYFAIAEQRIATAQPPLLLESA